MIDVPLHIMNETLYHDRTFQDWHRRFMPAEADGIDLDYLGVCRIWQCRKPLYAVESTTRDNKPTTILQRLAQDAGCFAIVVVHDTEQITGYRVVHNPAPRSLQVNVKPYVNADSELIGLLQQIRKHHAETCHSV